MDLTDIPDAVDTSDTDPPDFTAWDDPLDSLTGGSTRDRMLDVVVQLQEPRKVSAIAEQADCDTETARNYLQWFAEMGMVRERSERPVLYVRNESYFEWRRIEEIRSERSPEEIVSELADVMEQLKSYRERFDADSPEAVSLRESTDTRVAERWAALSEWRTLERRAELLDAARHQQDPFSHSTTANG